jgi:uncharacterized protein YukE
VARPGGRYVAAVAAENHPRAEPAIVSGVARALGGAAEDLGNRLAELDEHVAGMLRGRPGASGSAHPVEWELWHRGTAEVQVGLSIAAKLIAHADAPRHDPRHGSVDPDALPDAVARLADFHRHAESVLSEIDSLVTNLHASRSARRAAAQAEARRHWARGEAMMRESLARLRASRAAAHAD